MLEPTISAQTEVCKIGLQGFALGAQAAFGNSTLPAQTLLALGGKIKTWASHKLKTTVACVCVQGLGLEGLVTYIFFQPSALNLQLGETSSCSPQFSARNFQPSALSAIKLQPSACTSMCALGKKLQGIGRRETTPPP